MTASKPHHFIRVLGSRCVPREPPWERCATPFGSQARPRRTKPGPLYGLTFAIKDNIDLAGLPTTAACPAYAYTPTHTATVVQRLIAAGAIPIGKTNLDQFATGLVGTRSPYGACSSVFDERYISGGSSSGSAVAVAAGPGEFRPRHRHRRLRPRPRRVQRISSASNPRAASSAPAESSPLAARSIAFPSSRAPAAKRTQS